MVTAIVSLEKKSKNTYVLSGQLVFGTLPQLLGEYKICFDNDSSDKNINIDCSAVSHLDSAGIALLLDWKKNASSGGKKLIFNNLPKQAKAIIYAAHLSDLLITE